MDELTILENLSDLCWREFAQNNDLSSANAIPECLELLNTLRTQVWFDSIELAVKASRCSDQVLECVFQQILTKITFNDRV